MSVIVNDFSLDGQFLSIEEFLDSLAEITLPTLKILENLEVKIHKSYETYNIMITKNKSLYDLINIKGSAETARLKMMLINPYWSDEIKSSNKSIYKCEYTTSMNGYCLAEALERTLPVVSFVHDKFLESSIKIKKDNEEFMLDNLCNKNILLKIFRQTGKIDSLKYLLLKHSLYDSFGLSLGRDLFRELVDEAHLHNDDLIVIVDDMEKLIELTVKGEDPGRLSKPIEGKIKEFRTTLSGRREIRILYFEKGRKIIF
ncbi:hypothetical protein [Clostridium sp.]|uniref:hypothetical protein n=1 Tax=Clostridium sp. TaxID=1506 RepID=UPI003D6CDE6F